jgi:hypothetical protein
MGSNFIIINISIINMLKLVIVGTIAVIAQAIHPINDQVIRAIRERNSAWEAHDVETNPLATKTEEELQGLLGTFLHEDNEMYMESPLITVPDFFDGNAKWGSLVHPIRDQQQCGSCWAFGSSEAFSDRLAIASGSKINVVLSPEDMVSCD